MYNRLINSLNLEYANQQKKNLKIGRGHEQTIYSKYNRHIGKDTHLHWKIPVWYRHRFSLILTAKLQRPASHRCCWSWATRSLPGHLVEVKPGATLWEVIWEFHCWKFTYRTFPLAYTDFSIKIFIAALCVNSKRWKQLENLCRDLLRCIRHGQWDTVTL